MADPVDVRPQAIPSVTLLGRESEQAVIDELLVEMATGTRSVLIHGEAGQGKSSLLHWAVAAAQRRGCTVLRATGVEFERELTFGGLMAVLRPLLDRIDALATPQSSALQAAMGVTSGEVPLLMAYAATLGLISSAAEEAPVLVVVDDAQWVDSDTLAALLFAVHRLDADPVGFLFAQRSGLPCLLDRTSVPRVELSGLDRDAAVALLAGYGVAADVAERCWDLARGNPLALIEGVRGLSDSQRSGQEPLPPALPATNRLLAAFQARLDAQPDDAVQVLGMAALIADDDLTVLAAGVQQLGWSLAQLDPAERERLVRLADGRLHWQHPLLRSAVYQRVDGGSRRRAHRALAVVEQQAGHDDRALWHLAEAAVGPDDDLAAQLAVLGAAARRRGATAAADEAHQQAARLTTQAAEADRQVLAAADACWAGGDLTGTADRLSRRLPAVAAPETRAEMAILLGQAEVWTVGTAAGVARMERHMADAAAVADSRPDIPVTLLLHASTARMLGLDPARAVEAAERAKAFAARGTDPAAAFGASAIHALALVFDGAGQDAADQLVPLSQLLLALLDAGGARGWDGPGDSQRDAAHHLAQVCAFGLVACEQWAQATELLRRVVRWSETSGLVGASAFARLLITEVLWRTGRWAESTAELSQSLHLQQAMRFGEAVPGTMAMQARLEAGFGHDEGCRAHAAEALAADPGIEMFEAVAHSAVGLLELGAGRYQDAAACFDRVAEVAGDVHEPGWLWWQADAVEAYAGCGRRDDAQRTLSRLSSQANATGRSWALAATARAGSVVSPGDDADDRLTTALDGFRALGAPFEEARTLLARGHHRLRHGVRADGARDLASARTVFDRLGARAWSRRASALRGEESGNDDALTSQLTPAELRVVMVVGHGASNREAADQLFISVKTVDYHLQNAYRKLGLRSRNQLMTLVLADGTA